MTDTNSKQDVFEWVGKVTREGDCIIGETSLKYQDLTLNITSRIFVHKMHAEVMCYIQKRITSELNELLYFYKMDKTQYPDELTKWVEKLITKKSKELEAIAKQEDLSF